MPLPEKDFFSIPDVIERWKVRYDKPASFQDFTAYLGLTNDKKMWPWLLLNHHQCAAMNKLDTVLSFHERSGYYRVWHPMFIDNYFVEPFLESSIFVLPSIPDYKKIETLNCWQISLELTKKDWGVSTLKECRPEIFIPRQSLQSFENEHLKVDNPKRDTTVDSETKCTDWLSELMRLGQTNKSKSQYLNEALGKFERLSKRGFDRSWRIAISETGATWDKPGAKSKRELSQ